MGFPLNTAKSRNVPEEKCESLADGGVTDLA